MKPSEIQKEVELTLSSIDRIRKASAPTDFIDSFTSKMIFAEDQVKWINRAKLALASMVALAILNGVVVLKNQSEYKEFMLDSVAKQYHLKGDL